MRKKAYERKSSSKRLGKEVYGLDLGSHLDDGKRLFGVFCHTKQSSHHLYPPSLVHSHLVQDNTATMFSLLVRNLMRTATRAPAPIPLTRRITPFSSCSFVIPTPLQFISVYLTPPKDISNTSSSQRHSPISEYSHHSSPRGFPQTEPARSAANTLQDC